ncbi:MAG: type IV toxin-antitoxin system AbiEi family antitoxin domain-containing protein [Caldilineaceae bacterium]
MQQTDQVIQLLQSQGIIRPRDLADYGISRAVLYDLLEQGLVMRTGRGLYMLADTDFTEHHSLAEVCKRVPHGVVCLLSALRFHNLGTQNPHAVWLAIDHKARRPQLDYPPLTIVHFSGAALSEGIEQHQIEGVTVSVYNKAKTVADCFKYRNKIGLDIGLEALRECLTTRQSTYQELWQYAKICRVSNVMRPYLEAMTI